jgi:hypothetical protein
MGQKKSGDYESGSPVDIVALAWISNSFAGLTDMSAIDQPRALATFLPSLWVSTYARTLCSGQSRAHQLASRARHQSEVPPRAQPPSRLRVSRESARS